MKRKIKGFIKNVFSIINTKKKIEYFDRPAIWIEKILNQDSVFIVQVGSNDGVNSDPLYNLIQKNKNWEALFIEPVPYLFEKLRNNYKNQSRFIFENLAINDGSRQTFYSVNDSVKNKIPDLPKWYDQLGSFKRGHITKHLDGILEPFIDETIVNGATLQSVLNRNGIEKIDLLHIDAEGYDWLVLSQLDLMKFTPKIILYEHKHLSIEEKNHSLEFLKINNYSVYKLGSDFISIKSSTTNFKSFNGLKGIKVI